MYWNVCWMISGFVAFVAAMSQFVISYWFLETDGTIINMAMFSAMIVITAVAQFLYGSIYANVACGENIV